MEEPAASIENDNRILGLRVRRYTLSAASTAIPGVSRSETPAGSCSQASSASYRNAPMPTVTATSSLRPAPLASSPRAPESVPLYGVRLRIGRHCFDLVNQRLDGVSPSPRADWPVSMLKASAKRR